MSDSTPPNGQPFPGAGSTPTPTNPNFSQPGSGMPNHAAVPGRPAPSAIPLNPPSGSSAIPMNAPRPANGYAPTPAAPVQPIPSLSGQAPHPGQYPSAPGNMANPYPPQMPNGYQAQLPSGYQVPGQMPSNGYNATQNADYRPLSSSVISDGPNISMGVLVGAILAIVCGLGFGFISVAAGFRIPYLSLAIGYLIGYAVLRASKESGDVQGIIGGVCSLLACLLGLGVMFLNNIYFSPFALIIVAFATYRGYAIAADA